MALFYSIFIIKHVFDLVLYFGVFEAVGCRYIRVCLCIIQNIYIKIILKYYKMLLI